MEQFLYPVRMERDEDGRIVVSLVDFERSHTDGANMAEAFEAAADLLGSAIAARLAAGVLVPSPSKHKRGMRLIPVPLWIASKLALTLAMRDRKVNSSELARRLGVRETVIRRMLDPDLDSKPGSIEAALAVLGKQIVVGIEDAVAV